MYASESPEQTIARLQAELAAATTRANKAEADLKQVQVAVRAFKEKQERVAKARKAREERMRLDAQAAAAQLLAAQTPAPQDGAQPVGQLVQPQSSAMTPQSWAEHDPSLDDRLTKFLENGFEPDRSREWMLDDA